MAIVIAARSALRTVPALVTALGPRGELVRSVGGDIILPTFRGTATAWATAGGINPMAQVLSAPRRCLRRLSRAPPPDPAYARRLRRYHPLSAITGMPSALRWNSVSALHRIPQPVASSPPSRKSLDQPNIRVFRPSRKTHARRGRLPALRFARTVVERAHLAPFPAIWTHFSGRLLLTHDHRNFCKSHIATVCPTTADWRALEDIRELRFAA